MKKILCIALSLIAIATAFAACGKSSIKDTAIVPGVNGEIAAVTQENGDSLRDDDGNMIVVVTNPDGKPIKDENGENATMPVEISHCMVIGDKIEYSSFSVTIPDGWKAGKVYDRAVINSDDKNETDKIVIVSKPLSEYDPAGAAPGSELFSLTLGSDQIKVTKNTKDKVTIAGVEAERTRVDLTSDVIETRVLSYYQFQGPNSVYGVTCYSKDASTADKVFEEVLNTMVLY